MGGMGGMATGMATGMTSGMGGMVGGMAGGVMHLNVMYPTGPFPVRMPPPYQLLSPLPSMHPLPRLPLTSPRRL